MQENQYPVLVALNVLLFAATSMAQTCDPIEVDTLSGVSLSGSATAISDDTVVVGAPFYAVDGVSLVGAAYVFVRSGSAWEQQAILTASDGTYADKFGSAVAISGDTILVAAPWDGNAVTGTRGSVYVFVRSGSAWTEQAKLEASDGSGFDNFGYDVAITGDTAIIGSPHDVRPGLVYAGSVYVFVGAGSTWSEEVKLTASDAADADVFGSAVAISGNTIVIGSPQDDNDGGINAGSVYVFTGANSTWIEEVKLTASDAAEDAIFGKSVSINGDTLLAGAWAADSEGIANAGAAYVYTRSDLAWSEQAILKASDASSNDGFGTAVSIFGDIAFVSAIYADINAMTDAGSSYYFQRSGSTWIQVAKLSGVEHGFGSSMCIAGDTLILGSASAAVVFNLNCAGAYEGACCVSGQCALMRQPQCEGIGGAFQGVGVLCADSSCDPACIADIAPPSGNGFVDVDDLLEVINSWGTCP
jgi:hypothetical protein